VDFPAPDMQADIGQCRVFAAAGVAEIKTFDGYIAGNGPRESTCLSRRPVKCRLSLQQFKKPRSRTGCPLKLPDHFADSPGGYAHQQAVEHKGRQLTRGNATMNNIQPTNPDHTADRSHHQGNSQSGQPGALF
jgi:hypothetical protein